MPSDNQPPKTENKEVASPVPPKVLANSPEAAVAAVAEKQKKEKSKVQVSVRKILKLYIFPIVVLAIFLSMLIILILPKVGSIIDGLNQAGSNVSQATQLDGDIANLAALSSQSADMQANLTLINQVAPSGATEVVNFQQRLLQLAQTNSLKVLQSSLQESSQGTSNAASIANLGIIQIPSTFSLRGTFADLKKFVSGIQSLSDFVIIGEMSLRANVDPNNPISVIAGSGQLDDWTLTITLIKYQFQQPDAVNNLAQAFANVPVTMVINQSVLDFASLKFGTQASQ